MREKKKDNKSKKEENSGLLKAAVLGGGGAIGLNYLGRKLGLHVSKGIFEKAGMQSIAEEDEFLKRVTPKDIAISRGRSKGVEDIGPNAIESSRFEEKFGKELSDKLKSKGKKAAVEISWGKDAVKNGRGMISSTAHELGHAEHLVGRGSKLGRFAHKAWKYMPEYRTAGALGGIVAGSALSEDNPGLAAGIGAATGIASSLPEILSERAANKEGLKFLEKAGIGKEYVGRVKGYYGNQLGGRMLQKTLPAAGVGLAAGYITSRLKKHIKNKKKRNTEDE